MAGRTRYDAQRRAHTQQLQYNCFLVLSAIRPICLPVGEEQRRILDEEKVTITGWGATEYGKPSFTNPTLGAINPIFVQRNRKSNSP